MPELEELDNFLHTLKLHNKDLDICFNDALAVMHLKSLITDHTRQQVLEAEDKSYIKGWNDCLSNMPGQIKSKGKNL